MEEEKNSGIKYTVSNVPSEFQNSKEDEFEAVKKIYNVLKNFESNRIKNILDTLITFLNVELISKPFKITTLSDRSQNEVGTNLFSEDRSLTPKEFLFEKQPQTDIERVACLAFYLSHYRDTPQFKTLDLSKLNTEAAQLKFSNSTKAVDNAAQKGFLVPTSKGYKQMSALGELYVQALPDREEAKQVLKDNKPKKRAKKSRRNK